MNKIENTREESYVEIMITRLPKKNHEALLYLEKKSTGILGRERLLYDHVS
jgi:hypothetical protein